MRGNLKDNQAKLDSYEKSIKAALERKRKVIMESKQIAYDMLAELADDSSADADNKSNDDAADGQTSFFDEKSNPYAV